MEDFEYLRKRHLVKEQTPLMVDTRNAKGNRIKKDVVRAVICDLHKHMKDVVLEGHRVYFTTELGSFQVLKCKNLDYFDEKGVFKTTRNIDLPRTRKYRKENPDERDENGKQKCFYLTGKDHDYFYFLNHTKNRFVEGYSFFYNFKATITFQKSMNRVGRANEDIFEEVTHSYIRKTNKKLL